MRATLKTMNNKYEGVVSKQKSVIETPTFLFWDHPLGVSSLLHHAVRTDYS